MKGSTQTVACEKCGKVGEASNAVDRQDESGIWFVCCPDCAGEYETVYLKEDGRGWVVTKANHHEISRHRSRGAARDKAEQIAFNVEIR